MHKSVTDGIISGFDRSSPAYRMHFNQSNAAIYGGSSGGGFFRKDDGRYIGMLTRGIGNSVALYIPAREIKTWLDDNNVSFIHAKHKPIRALKILLAEPKEEPRYTVQPEPKPKPEPEIIITKPKRPRKEAIPEPIEAMPTEKPTRPRRPMRRPMRRPINILQILDEAHNAPEIIAYPPNH